MKVKNLFNNQHIGITICVCSMLLLFILQIPLNLSVVSPNDNQGFAFVWGQNLLKWGELAPGRGLIFVSLYSLIVKLFGFGVWAIIATHFISTTVLFLIGLIIFLIIRNLTNNYILAGFATAFWTISVISPIGGSSTVIEILSNFNLSEELLCTIFTVFSIYFLLLAGFFNEQALSSFHKKMFSVLAGMFAICSLMIKVNGAIVFISTVLWLLITIKNRNIKTQKIYYISGVIFSVLFFSVILLKIGNSSFANLLKDYFFIGQYSDSPLTSFKFIFRSIRMFLTRESSSLNNTLLFSLSTIIFIISTLFLFTKHSKNSIFNFLGFVGILGIGNSIAIVMPGSYQPYYYQLIWPSVAISFSLFLYLLTSYFKIKRIFLFGYLCFLMVLLLHKFYISIPSHCFLTRNLLLLNIYNQPKSFQDPVLAGSHPNTEREVLLQMGDRINNLIPNKSDTLYIFNLSNRISCITPLTYIYSKRYPPTTVDSNLLQITNIVESKINRLQSDLIKRNPKIIIVAKELQLFPWQKEIMSYFLEWFTGFIQANYTFETTLSCVHPDNKIETFIVYRKNHWNIR